LRKPQRETLIPMLYWVGAQLRNGAGGLWTLGYALPDCLLIRQMGAQARVSRVQGAQ